MPRHKHADVIHAWAEGEEIEYRRNPEEWSEAKDPTWLTGFEYRIKPKIVKKEGWVREVDIWVGKPAADETEGYGFVRIEWEEEV